MTHCYRPNIFNYIFAKNFYTPTEGRKSFIRKIGAFREHNCLMKFNEKKIKKNSLKIKDFIKNNNFDVYALKKNFYIKARLLSIM
jgi:hypothetical protein